MCLDEVKGERDEMQWPPAWVTNEDGERRRYWVLHFPEEPEDLLDIDLSTYGPLDEVVKGYLDRKKAVGRHVMPSPDGDFVSFLVSERGRNAIVASGCEGIEFHQDQLSPVYRSFLNIGTQNGALTRKVRQKEELGARRDSVADSGSESVETSLALRPIGRKLSGVPQANHLRVKLSQTGC
jgi:hypothetical protein